MVSDRNWPNCGQAHHGVTFQSLLSWIHKALESCHHVHWSLFDDTVFLLTSCRLTSAWPFIFLSGTPSFFFFFFFETSSLYVAPVSLELLDSRDPTATGCQWLIPVILVTWDAKTRRIAVQGQPGQIVFETPHLQNNQSKMDWRCG
jgi:hypothetical protein